jgi:DNA-directed RNA polymerase specialized sigma24 family protein
VVRKRTAAIDIENLTRVGARRRTALRGAYEDHGGLVHAVAQGLCGPEAAADVTREVFLRLWREPERFSADPRDSLRAALLRLTHDVAADAASRRQERTDRPLAVLRPAELEAIVAVLYGGCSSREAGRTLGRSDLGIARHLRDGLRNVAAATAVSR